MVARWQFLTLISLAVASPPLLGLRWLKKWMFGKNWGDMGSSWKLYNWFPFHNTVALYAKESSSLSKCHTGDVDRELNSWKRALVEIIDSSWKFLLGIAVAVTSFWYVLGHCYGFKYSSCTLCGGGFSLSAALLCTWNLRASEKEDCWCVLH